MLHPIQQPRLLWDYLMLGLTVTVGVAVPVMLVHGEGGETSRGAGGALMNGVSAAWLVDVVLNFRTGAIAGGRVVFSWQRVGARYARSWLALDLLTAWPPALAPREHAVLQVLAAAKLLRLLRLGPLLAKLQKTHHRVWLPIRIALMVLLLAHAMACTWRVVLHADAGQGEVSTGDAEAGGLRLHTWWERYISDAYWVMMTMTTVGYGDVHPIGTQSRIFAILAMLVAPLFFGTVVSLLTHATRGIFNDEVENQVAEAADFLRQRQMPMQLQRRVEHNLRHHILQERQTLSPDLFAKLSPAVQRELSLELLRNTVLQFPLFQDVQHSFVAELAQAHSWVQCLPGDIVVEEGQLMQEVVFVLRGRLLMQSSESSGQQCSGGNATDEGAGTPSDRSQTGSREEELVELGAGAWFSEAALFFVDCIRTATVVAAVESELAVLPVSEYHRIVQKFPRLQERHRNIERALRVGTQSLSDFAFRASRDEPRDEPWCMWGSCRRRCSTTEMYVQ